MHSDRTWLPNGFVKLSPPRNNGWRIKKNLRAVIRLFSRAQVLEHVQPLVHHIDILTNPLWYDAFQYKQKAELKVCKTHSIR